MGAGLLISGGRGGEGELELFLFDFMKVYHVYI